jgi:OOP family OmpA-OmpF porin
MMKRIAQWIVAGCAAGLAGVASAQWYAGAMGGWSQGGPDANRISSQLVDDLGFFSAETSTDDNDGAWRIFGGYQFLPWLAVEASYLDAGKSSWASSVQPPGTFNASLDTTAWTVGLAARYEFNPQLAVHARISAARVETEGRFSSSGFVELVTDRHTIRRTVPAFAVGVEWSFNPNLAARVEFERLARISGDELGGKFDLDLLMLGVRYRF